MGGVPQHSGGQTKCPARETGLEGWRFNEESFSGLNLNWLIAFVGPRRFTRLSESAARLSCGATPAQEPVRARQIAIRFGKKVFFYGPFVFFKWTFNPVHVMAV